MSEQERVIAGRYRVLGRIGTGGMADVLRAHDEMLDRDVAVKVFRSVVTGPDGTSDTAKGVERQRAELAALARLNHPNLTMLYDGSIVGQQGPAYLVMELIDGPSLAQAIVDGGLAESQARVVGAQIGDALAYVHAAGMVHRDVKPANILLGNIATGNIATGNIATGNIVPGADRHGPGEGLRARLTDFGIVRLVGDEPLTRADMTLGSASYLAPEQARGWAVGPPADVYALGLTLIEALTGRRSFDGPALEAVVARLTKDPEIPGGLPEPWPALLRAMTARDPAYRPTAARVASTLRGTESLTAPITSVPAATYDTAVLPAVAAAAYAPAPRRPVGPPTGSRATALPVEPEGHHWSASLIIAGILVLALVIAGIALLLVSGSGGGSEGGSTTPSQTGRSSTAPASTTAPRTSHSTSPTPTSTHPTQTSSTPSDSTSEAPSTASTPSTSAGTPSTTPTTASSPSTTPTRSASPASSKPAATRTTSAAAGAVQVTPTPSTSTTST